MSSALHHDIAHEPVPYVLAARQVILLHTSHLSLPTMEQKPATSKPATSKHQPAFRSHNQFVEYVFHEPKIETSVIAAAAAAALSWPIVVVIGSPRSPGPASACSQARP